MTVLRTIVLEVLCFSYLHFVCGKNCTLTTLEAVECSDLEICKQFSNNEQYGHCDCIQGYKRVDEKCIKVNGETPQPNSSSLVEETAHSHVVAGILIPLVLVILVIIVVYFSRKYEVVNWMKTKVNQRYSPPTYDEVMIGNDFDDDDPPLQ